MITHHPKSELINQYVDGVLPASISAAISMHATMCSQCNESIIKLTAQKSALVFEQKHFENNIDVTDDLMSMIEGITNNDDITEYVKTEPKKIVIKNQQYELPATLNNMSLSNWQNLGKLARSRIELNEAEIHCSLLHIDKTGSVPKHTHKGFELTLLLEGKFSDEMGSYEKGDFIWLNGEHTHNPSTEQGCLCFTVVNDALEFKQGLAKLLNPIGNFIY